MNSKIKVGDRVSGQWISADNTIEECRGTLHRFLEDGFASVLEGRTFRACLPKTLRRLKKKEPKYLWLNDYGFKIIGYKTKEDADKGTVGGRIRFLKVRVVKEFKE